MINNVETFRSSNSSGASNPWIYFVVLISAMAQATSLIRRLVKATKISYFQRNRPLYHCQWLITFKESHVKFMGSNYCNSDFVVKNCVNSVNLKMPKNEEMKLILYDSIAKRQN